MTQPDIVKNPTKYQKELPRPKKQRKNKIPIQKEMEKHRQTKEEEEIIHKDN